MHPKSLIRQLRILTISVSFIVLTGCFGEGDGPVAIPDIRPPQQVGRLISSAVSGVTYQTQSQSGITSTAGEYNYQVAEKVTFTIGDIVLGTVDAAEFVTPVELTGSEDPADQAAINMLVFLQSIDADQDHSTGITISPETLELAQGQTLDFRSPDFAADVETVVDTIAPGNAIVGDKDALDNFYDSYVELDGSLTFPDYDFPSPTYPPSPTPRDSLVDGGFEPPRVPDAIAGNTGSCGSFSFGAWSSFNCNFVTSTNGPSSAPVSHDVGGTQSMIQFGVDAGIENFIEARNGDIVKLTAYAMSWEPDAFNNLAIVQLTFWDAPGGRNGGGNQVGPAIETFADTLGNQPHTLLPQDGAEVTDWTKMSVSGIAPAGTQSAQVLLIHILIDGTPSEGALYWDDVRLTATPPGDTSPGPDTGFELLWEDNFDIDGAPSPNNWTIETGYGNNGWGNNEWQLYTDDPANVRVEDGNLVISAQCGSSSSGGNGVPQADGVNVLLNASFEEPDASTGDIGNFPCGADIGMPGWTTFNCNFVSSNLNFPGGNPINPFGHDPFQVLKQFGTDAGVFQDVAAAPGDIVEASAYAINWEGDPFNNLGLLQIFFLDAGGNNISGGFTPAAQVVADSVGNADYQLLPQVGFVSDEWTLMEVSATAPPGTASARIQMIHVLSDGQPTGGALWWDDASLTISPAPVECGVRDDTVTSARINTINSLNFTYGKIQARIKPPVGKGAWPAFWMLGSNFPDIGWPRSGEIDIMEMFNTFGSNPQTAHATMHWCDERIQFPDTCSFPEGRVFQGGRRVFESSLGDDFHIFEAVWDADKIVFKVDDLEVYSRTIDPEMEEFTRDFFLILNVAMGGTLGSADQPPDGTEIWPQTMLVDWVRVFQETDP